MKVILSRTKWAKAGIGKGWLKIAANPELLAAAMKLDKQQVLAAIKRLGEQSIAGFSGVTVEEVDDVLNMLEDYELSEIIANVQKHPVQQAPVAPLVPQADAKNGLTKTAGDEWADERTYEFVAGLLEVMSADPQVDGAGPGRSGRNVIEFNYSVEGRWVELDMTVREFGYGNESESLNATITSPINERFRIPGGFTRSRNPQEMWVEAKKSIDEIFRMALHRE